jgi:Family of unknown function (DUF5715)
MAAHASVFAIRRVLVTATLLLLTVAPSYGRSRRHGPPPVRIFQTAGSLQAQNAEADRLYLPRIKNDDQLRELIADGELTIVQPSPALRVGLPAGRAYLRPWAADALTAISNDFFAATGHPLMLDSAVRTIAFQKRLRRWNRNAAPADGPTATVHTTGIAFDIQRRKMNPAELRWLEWHLFYLQAIGRVIVEEEVQQQSCFHIVAIKSGPRFTTPEAERDAR